MLQAFTYAVSIYCLVIFYFLTVCHGRFKMGVVLGIIVNDSSISLGVFRMYSLLNPSPIKGYVRHHFPSFLFYSVFEMEATIDIELLPGNNEQVIKEAAIVANNAHMHYLFRPPYHMEPHGSKENGWNWDDGFLLYSQVQTVLTEALAPYDHLYAWGEDKCLLLGDILNRPIHDLEAIECPSPSKLKSDIHWQLTCHSFPDMR